MCDDIFFEHALDQSANVVHRGRVMPSELLRNLMEQAHHSRLVLPDFQRDFVWKPQDVTKLLASLLNGYPIGGLLFMENPALYGQRSLRTGNNDLRRVTVRFSIIRGLIVTPVDTTLNTRNF